MSGRILVIRGGAIGDFILTLPALRLLRENFPYNHLEILGYKHIVALAEGRGYADATRSIEYGPLSRFFIPNTELAPDLVEYFGSFAQVISYLFDPDGFFEGNLRRAGVKNLICGSPKINDTAHAAQQLAAPLQRLALYLEERGAVVHPAPRDHAVAEALLQGGNGPVIALHPGSGGVKKKWPAGQWAALGEWLADHPSKPRLLVIGGEADGPELALLRDRWRGFSPILAEGLPLPELAALLSRCALFLGHDSGISHLAAAVGTRSLLLFGPTDPDVWAPANPWVRVRRAPGGSLEHLELETVRLEVAEMLSAAT